jgi:hypothetical protein
MKFSNGSVYLREEALEDTKGVIRIHKSKDRQHNVQKKKDKQWSTKHTHRTKDRVTRTPLKTGGELWCSRGVGHSCSTKCTRPVNHKFGQNPLKDVDSSVHKDAMQYKFDLVTLTFDLENR